MIEAVKDDSKSLEVELFGVANQQPNAIVSIFNG